MEQFTNRYHSHFTKKSGEKFKGTSIKIGDFTTSDDGKRELVVTGIIDVTFEENYIIVTGEGRDRNE